MLSASFLLMSGRCSKSQPVASDPCSTSFTYSSTGNSWLNTEVSNYPKSITSGGVTDNVTLLTISQYVLPGDYVYYVFWEYHSEYNSLNSFGSLYNCNGDLLCSAIEVDPLSTYDATNYSSCENPYTPQNIDFNNPDNSWVINSRPQPITNACNGNFSQPIHSSWISNVVNANATNYPYSGYELQRVYQTDLNATGSNYQYVYEYLDVTVSSPSQHDEWYQWYDCNGNLLCEDDGDNAVNACSNTVPRWLNASQIIRTWNY